MCSGVAAYYVKSILMYILHWETEQDEPEL